MPHNMGICRTIKTHRVCFTSDPSGVGGSDVNRTWCDLIPRSPRSEATRIASGHRRAPPQPRRRATTASRRARPHAMAVREPKNPRTPSAAANRPPIRAMGASWAKSHPGCPHGSDLGADCAHLRGFGRATLEGRHAARERRAGVVGDGWWRCGGAAKRARQSEAYSCALRPYVHCCTYGRRKVKFLRFSTRKGKIRLFLSRITKCGSKIRIFTYRRQENLPLPDNSGTNVSWKSKFTFI